MEDATQRDEAALTIGQVAERTGLSVHALRFYERQGILADPVERTAGGRRVYSERDVEWIANCTKFRASGMPVATIRRFAQLVRSGEGNENQRLELLREHRQIVIERIAELTGCLDLISRKVAAYEESIAQGTIGELWRGPAAS
jgi:DNA-binding transcriptional MerR regulator